MDVRDCFPFDFARLPKYLYGGQAQGRKDRYRVSETNVDVFARESRRTTAAISEGCQSVDVRDCFVANTPRKDFTGEFENTISVFARESRRTTAAISG